jgi:nucleoside-diphosphate-sugar epimerase
MALTDSIRKFLKKEKPTTVAAIPLGSLVLVTGVNGFIGSHIANEILAAGYRVRGTARSEQKGAAISQIFQEKYGSKRFELVIVEQMSRHGAFDSAVKGCSGVVHTASTLTFDADPNAVIPEVIDGIKSILKSTQKEPLVKRFVYTSSSTACAGPKPNKVFTIDADTWNDEEVEAAWAPPPYEDDRKWAVYGASKTLAEQEMWKFVEEEKPGFVANAVLPNANFGPLIEKSQPGSTNQWPKIVYSGGVKILKDVPPQWFVDVRDTALLHLACLISEDIANERVFGFSEPFNWNSLLAIARQIKPGGKIVGPDGEEVKDLENNDQDLSIIAGKARAESILRSLGREGFRSLEESFKDNVEGL